MIGIDVNGPAATFEPDATYTVDIRLGRLIGPQWDQAVIFFDESRVALFDRDVDEQARREWTRFQLEERRICAGVSDSRQRANGRLTEFDLQVGFHGQPLDLQGLRFPKQSLQVSIIAIET
jgi:hypothetical protein